MNKGDETFLYVMIALAFAGIALLGAKTVSLYSKVFPNSSDDLIKKKSDQAGIPDARWYKAILANESSVGANKAFEPIGGTRGFSHVIYDAAKEVMPSLTKEQHADLINNPDLDIELGAKFFKKKLNDFAKYGSKQLEYAVKAYNGGTGRMNQIIAGQSSATIDYAKSNMDTYWNRFQSNLAKIGVAA